MPQHPPPLSTLPLVEGRRIVTMFQHSFIRRASESTEMIPACPRFTSQFPLLLFSSTKDLLYPHHDCTQIKRVMRALSLPFRANSPRSNKNLTNKEYQQTHDAIKFTFCIRAVYSYGLATADFHVRWFDLRWTYVYISAYQRRLNY